MVGASGIFSFGITAFTWPKGRKEEWEGGEEEKEDEEEGKKDDGLGKGTKEVKSKGNRKGHTCAYICMCVYIHIYILYIYMFTDI